MTLKMVVASADAERQGQHRQEVKAGCDSPEYRKSFKRNHIPTDGDSARLFPSERNRLTKLYVLTDFTTALPRSVRIEYGPSVTPTSC
jgi:hypothetical protein